MGQFLRYNVHAICLIIRIFHIFQYKCKVYNQPFQQKLMEIHILVQAFCGREIRAGYSLRHAKRCELRYVAKVLHMCRSIGVYQ